MTDQLPKEVILELTKQLKTEGLHFSPSLIRVVNGYSVTFSYNSAIGVAVKTFKKEAENTQKSEPTTLDLLLNEGLANGAIVKSGVAWYAYKGENYNGIKAIKEALVNTKQ